MPMAAMQRLKNREWNAKRISLTVRKIECYNAMQLQRLDLQACTTSIQAILH